MFEKPTLENVPKHIAIIMDGNGRWASKRGLPKNLGHKAGAKTLKKVATLAEELGVKYLTVFAFSTENWKRSSDEVSGLMQLLNGYLDDYIKDTKKNDMRISVIGDTTVLEPILQEKIKTLTELCAEKKGLRVIIALNYGGRQDILNAVKRLSFDLADNKLTVQQVTEDIFSEYLDTKGIPDPELLIRTSGEMRISNFLLWQLAYTELYFTKSLWPDFKKSDFVAAIEWYQKRDRRFGGRS